MRGRDRLAQARDRLARWRAEHGGCGIRVPEALWAEDLDAGWSLRALKLRHAVHSTHSHHLPDHASLRAAIARASCKVIRGFARPAVSRAYEAW